MFDSDHVEYITSSLKFTDHLNVSKEPNVCVDCCHFHDHCSGWSRQPLIVNQLLHCGRRTR